LYTSSSHLRPPPRSCPIEPVYARFLLLLLAHLPTQAPISENASLEIHIILSYAILTYISNLR
jgi:hypothetical protein